MAAIPTPRVKEKNQTGPFKAANAVVAMARPAVENTEMTIETISMVLGVKHLDRGIHKPLAMANEPQ